MPMTASGRIRERLPMDELIVLVSKAVTGS